MTSGGLLRSRRLWEDGRVRAGLIGGYCVLTRWLAWLFARFFLRRTPDWRWRRFTEDLQGSAHHEAAPRYSATELLIWLHAASAGELEMLWSVARAIRAHPHLHASRLALSVFSPSARSRLSQFDSEFSPVYCGPSPWEGEWHRFFELFHGKFGRVPDLFVSAKYEVWPELWGELARRRVPLLMVNAEWRRSLRWGAKLTRWIFGRLPRIRFATASPERGRQLSESWIRVSADVSACPSSEVRVTGDPRWDQVQYRLDRSSCRVQALKDAAERKGLPRPWVIVGSAWKEDLVVLLEAAAKSTFEGTLWLVPHRPSSDQARDWLEVCSRYCPDRVRSSGDLSLGQDLSAAPRAGQRGFHAFLVQEMGVLAELYRLGDAAWVGGGFRTGLHSVIEPALSNLRIGAGKRTAAPFAEVEPLCTIGQLELFDENSEAVARWLSNASTLPSAQTCRSWEEWRNSDQIGASARVAAWAAEIVSAPGAV